MVRRLRGVGIGVLIDIHGLPGGANGDEHSGTSAGKAGLWGDRREEGRARGVVRGLVGEVRKGEIGKGKVDGEWSEGVVGVQVVNEAVWGAGRRGMYKWYERVLEDIAEIDGDGDMIVYVSDAWDLEGCLEWVQKRKGKDGNPVVVDTHRYYTFTERDKRERPGEIIQRVKGELGEVKQREGRVVDRGEAQVVVGEWSCVMSEETWARVPAAEREAYTREFGLAQSRQWQERAGGAFFWTMKMGWMDGGGWGFVEQTRKGNITPPPWLLLSLDEVRRQAQAAEGRRAELAETARRSHEAYWTRTAPRRRFEHQLYSEGWEVGFSDALSFFTARAEGRLAGGAGGDKIGLLEVWVKKRLRESGERGRSPWEWEHGMRAGVAALYAEVGV